MGQLQIHIFRGSVGIMFALLALNVFSDALGQFIIKPIIPQNPKSTAECTEMYSKYDQILADLRLRANQAGDQGSNVYSSNSPCGFDCINSANPYFEESRRLLREHSDLLNEARRAREICLSRVRVSDDKGSQTLGRALKRGAETDPTLKSMMKQWDKLKNKSATARALWELANGKGPWKEKYQNIETVVIDSFNRLPGNALAKKLFEQNIEAIMSIHISSLEQLEFVLNQLDLQNNSSDFNAAFEPVDKLENAYGGATEDALDEINEAREVLRQEVLEYSEKAYNNAKDTRSRFAREAAAEFNRRNRIDAERQAIIKREIAAMSQSSQKQSSQKQSSQKQSSQKQKKQSDSGSSRKRISSCADAEAWVKRQLETLNKEFPNDITQRQACQMDTNVANFLRECTNRYQQCGMNPSDIQYKHCRDNMDSAQRQADHCWGRL